jgi:hypothetical protein
MDLVVAGIRQALGAEPPENDPFAPSPERAVAPVPQPKPPQPKEPGMRIRTEPAKTEPVPAQKAQAMKAAQLFIRATGGNGLRTSLAKQGKSRKSKHHQGRGPPR